jgi:phage terminase small subunit
MGRPRKPIEAKILDGTYREDRDGPLPQAVFEGVPSPPPDMKGDALKFWKKHVPELVAKGIAKAIDGPQLALMCEWWAKYQRFSRMIEKMKNEDRRLVQAMTGCAIASDKFDKIAARFGLTPSDRAKLRVSDQPKKQRAMGRDRNQDEW